MDGVEVVGSYSHRSLTWQTKGPGVGTPDTRAGALKVRVGTLALSPNGSYSSLASCGQVDHPKRSSDEPVMPVLLRTAP
jgi:hypothetical protein